MKYGKKKPGSPPKKAGPLLKAGPQTLVYYMGINRVPYRIAVDARPEDNETRILGKDYVVLGTIRGTAIADVQRYARNLKRKELIENELKEMSLSAEDSEKKLDKNKK